MQGNYFVSISHTASRTAIILNMISTNCGEIIIIGTRLLNKMFSHYALRTDNMYASFQALLDFFKVFFSIISQNCPKNATKNENYL